MKPYILIKETRNKKNINKVEIDAEISQEKNDLSNKAVPTSITLRCKAIKKFLPYEGFYPCQRTVDIAKQFYNSYALNLSGSSWGTHQNLSASNTPGTNISETSKYINNFIKLENKRPSDIIEIHNRPIYAQLLPINKSKKVTNFRRFCQFSTS